MYSISQLIGNKGICSSRINVDVTIVRETLKAYLISFDPFDYGSGFGRREWLPKSWILGIKRLPDGQPSTMPNKPAGRHLIGGQARITISEANWTRKFD